MKKVLYSLIVALACCTVAKAQSWVVVIGQLTNTGGVVVPVYLSTDSITYTTVNTDASGNFFDSIPVNSTQGVVYVVYHDCNNVAHSTFVYYNPGQMLINYTADYCPNASTTAITVYGQLNNTSNAAITVSAITDYGTYTGVTGGSGTFLINAQANSVTDPVYIYFTDCNGIMQLDTVQAMFGSTIINYSANYCTSSGGGCGTLFTTTYDAATNVFTLTMDSATTAAMNTVAYQWNFGDGTLSTQAMPTHVYAVNGLYNVCLTITNNNGYTCNYCHTIGIDSLGNAHTRVDQTGFTVNVVPFGSTLGVKNFAAAAFEMYPNPVSNKTFVTFYADHAAVYSFSIYNALGQEIKSFNVATQAGANNVTLPLSDLSSGAYLLSVRFDGKQISRAFVK